MLTFICEYLKRSLIYICWIRIILKGVMDTAEHQKQIARRLYIRSKGRLGLRLLTWTALKCRTLGASYIISVYACPVLFLPVQSLLTCFRSSLTRFADFVSLSSSSLISLPQTVGLRPFYVSLCSQAPQQQYTVLSFSLMRRHGHSHKLTSSRAPLYYTVGIPFSDA